MFRKLVVLAGLLVALGLPSSLMAQATREDDSVFANVSGFARIVPQAQIRVCAQPASFNAKGQCTNFTTAFTDTTGAISCNGSNGCSQFPINADSNGNYHYYVATGTYTLQRMYANGTVINTIVDHSVGSSGGGGGSTSPTTPVGSLQFNLDTLHFGGASSLLFHPGVSCLGSVTGTCDTLTTAASPANALQLNFISPDSTGNFLLSTNSATVINGGLFYQNRADQITWANGYSFAGRLQHTVKGNAGTNQTGYGLYSVATDLSSDITSGQNLTAGYFGVGLTKSTGVNLVTGVKIGRPSTIPLAPTSATITETALQAYGLDVDDQRAVGTALTTQIHLQPATPCANCYVFYGEPPASANAPPFKLSGTMVSSMATPLLADTLPLSWSWAYNNNAITFTGIKFAVTNSASIVGSSLIQFCGGAAANVCTKVGADGGTLTVPTSVATQNASVAGGVLIGQGPNATPLANTIIHQAPTSVQASGVVRTEQSVPPNGTLMAYKSSGTGSQESSSGDPDHSIDTGTRTASIGSTSLCALAICGAGVYEVNVHVEGTVSCGTPGPGAVAVSIIYTDDTAGSKTAIVPLASLAGSYAANMPFTNATTNQTGSGMFIVRSNGTAAINYSTTYTACTSGTGTYRVFLNVTQGQ